MGIHLVVPGLPVDFDIVFFWVHSYVNILGIILYTNIRANLFKLCATPGGISFCSIQQ